MEELLGTWDGRPSELTEALYDVWSEGGWGLIISGAYKLFLYFLSVQ